MPGRLGKLMRWAGYVLLLAALTYLVLALGRLDLAQVAARLGPDGWAQAGAGAIGYAALLGLLARAWSRDAAQCRPTGWASALTVYGPGVIAKYIPGSVFQYASRQMLGARLRWSHAAMARASLFEAGMHVPCALAVAGALWLTGSAWGIAPLLLVGASLLLLGSHARITAAGLQLLFFSGFGLIVWWLAGDMLDLVQPDRVAALFMLAWVAGLLVPVAPGGVGVRESALLVLSAPYADPASLAAFAILTRLVTMAGDALFGLAAYSVLLRTRLNRQASA